jgi:hypothetical protein
MRERGRKTTASRGRLAWEARGTQLQIRHTLTRWTNEPEQRKQDPEKNCSVGSVESNCSAGVAVNPNPQDSKKEKGRRWDRSSPWGSERSGEEARKTTDGGPEAREQQTASPWTGSVWDGGWLPASAYIVRPAHCLLSHDSHLISGGRYYLVRRGLEESVMPPLSLAPVRISVRWSKQIGCELVICELLFFLKGVLGWEGFCLFASLQHISPSFLGWGRDKNSCSAEVGPSRARG